MKYFAKIVLTSVILLTIISFSANSQTWSTVGTGLNKWGRIESMCEYNGELYVGGIFDSIGGLHVNSLAKWNGIFWDSVPGMTSFADIEIFDMVVYHNELICVGNAMKKWNGTIWSNISGSIDNRQFAVEVYNDELYITGHFENVDGIPTRGIAKWNGTTWDSVGGPGLNLQPGFVGSSLQTYNGDLYLGGGFYLINGLPVHSIARWNGTVWDSVGILNIGESFWSLCEYNNKLYAGGVISFEDNPYYIMISSWNSISWDSVGNGLNYIPKYMSVYNNELYAAGDFDTAGNIQTFGIARWNDSQWNSVGSGLDLFHINQDTIVEFGDTIYLLRERIITMGTYNNELYVGGTFSMIGGITANSIAKWHIVGASLNEINNNLNVSIFPNPASDYLTLSLPINISNAEIKIFNLLGELNINSKTENQITTINISDLTAGIYFIEVRSGNKINRQKIIKQ